MEFAGNQRLVVWNSRPIEIAHRPMSVRGLPFRSERIVALKREMVASVWEPYTDDCKRSTAPSWGDPQPVSRFMTGHLDS